mmetsp:Transcript_24216/g.53915  ORF Transcript_24216/g.53915 Transcript_24216/m.53915 type:complete len:357 (-) Transcript_24216:2131-3201(-)
MPLYTRPNVPSPISSPFFQRRGEPASSESTKGNKPRSRLGPCPCVSVCVSWPSSRGRLCPSSFSPPICSRPCAGEPELREPSCGLVWACVYTPPISSRSTSLCSDSAGDAESSLVLVSPDFPKSPAPSPPSSSPTPSLLGRVGCRGGASVAFASAPSSPNASPPCSTAPSVGSFSPAIALTPRPIPAPSPAPAPIALVSCDARKAAVEKGLSAGGAGLSRCRLLRAWCRDPCPGLGLWPLRGPGPCRIARAVAAPWLGGGCSFCSASLWVMLLSGSVSWSWLSSRACSTCCPSSLAMWWQRSEKVGRRGAALGKSSCPSASPSACACVCAGEANDAGPDFDMRAIASGTSEGGGML